MGSLHALVFDAFDPYGDVNARAGNLSAFETLYRTCAQSLATFANSFVYARISRKSSSTTFLSGSGRSGHPLRRLLAYTRIYMVPSVGAR